MENNNTIEVLTNIKKELDLALSSMSKTKVDSNFLKELREDEMLKNLIKNLSSGFVCTLEGESDLISNYELRMDYGNTVELESYDLNFDYVKEHSSTLLEYFFDSIIVALKDKLEIDKD